MCSMRFLSSNQITSGIGLATCPTLHPASRYDERNVSGVYVSYPFCAQKCTYCNFASGVLPAALEPEYVDALVSEIASQAWFWTPETVYIGGGTPSRMELSSLERI